MVISLLFNSLSANAEKSPSHFPIKPSESKLVEIPEPHANSVWYAGTEHLIDWDPLVEGAEVHELHLYKNSQLFVRDIAYPYYLIYTCTYWTIPVSIPSGDDYQIVATEVTGDSVIGRSEDFTIINEQDKSLANTSPRASTLWAPEKVEEISWYPIGDIQQVRIELYYDGRLERVITEGTNNYRSYSWSVPEDFFLTLDTK